MNGENGWGKATNLIASINPFLIHFLRSPLPFCWCSQGIKEAGAGTDQGEEQGVARGVKREQWEALLL